MCEYCEQGNRIGIVTDNEGFFIHVEGVYLTVSVDGDGETLEASAEIRFCPMCGAELQPETDW